MDLHPPTPPDPGPHLAVSLPGSGLALLCPVSVPVLQAWLTATHTREPLPVTAQLIPWTWPAAPRRDFGLTGTQLLPGPPRPGGEVVTAQVLPGARSVTLDVPGRPGLRSATLSVSGIRALMLAGLRETDVSCPNPATNSAAR